MNSLTFTCPDDWHAHFRDLDLMRLVAPYTARNFGRAIAMPNLSPPVVKLADCAAYQQRLQSALGDCQPLVTLYLTDLTTPNVIREVKPAADSYDVVFGAKLYPRGATTNADSGVSDPLKIMPVFEAMAERRLPLLIHGEATDPDVDVYDREQVFIDQAFIPLRERLPELKMVFEHITTRPAIDVVKHYANTAATITPHHLHYTRSAMFENGLHPHRYCLPLAKREADRQALIDAACSGDASFFAGTDSAPHTVDAKQSACGCAGIFNAPCALETYAEIFERAESLDKLEKFVALNGAQFYELPPNPGKVTLVKQAWQVPDAIGDGALTIVPFRSGETMSWRSLGKTDD